MAPRHHSPRRPLQTKGMSWPERAARPRSCFASAVEPFPPVVPTGLVRDARGPRSRQGSRHLPVLGGVSSHGRPGRRWADAGGPSGMPWPGTGHGNATLPAAPRRQAGGATGSTAMERRPPWAMAAAPPSRKSVNAPGEALAARLRPREAWIAAATSAARRRRVGRQPESA